MFGSKFSSFDVAFYRRKIAAVRKAQEVSIDETAQEFADAVEAAAPKDEYDLASTVRVVKRGPLESYVAAGGSKTTKPVKEGQSSTYDYARANAFGTSEMEGTDFFHGPIRQRKKAARRRMNKRVRAAMENG